MMSEKFLEDCNKCWSENYRFLVINLTLKNTDGKHMDKFEVP